MATFFISYSRQDAAIANEIRNHIARLDASHDVFLDIASLKVGSNWKSELRKRIMEANSELCHCLIFRLLAGVIDSTAYFSAMSVETHFKTES